MQKGSHFTIGSKIRDFSIECGQGAPVLVIGNIGTTLQTDSIEEEISKAKAAYKSGADIITDHSITGNVEILHRQLLESISCPISTVAIYQAYIEAKNKNNFSPKDIVKLFEKQARLGFDLITVHGTILKEDLLKLAFSKRLIPCASRGGMMMANLMMEKQIENPYWSYFRDIVDISKAYRVSLSLGTAFRPASIVDEPDELYYTELRRMSELVEIAINNNVGIMVEGIGHARMDIIPDLIKKTKLICRGVPYRVLCVACDSAIHHDHIASAIASAISVASGADVISAVSRSEHLGRPSINDVIEAVETAKIAAHCGEIVRRNYITPDKEISMARGATYSCSAEDKTAILQREEASSDYYCTMCGKYCALKIMRGIKNIMGEKAENDN